MLKKIINNVEKTKIPKFPFNGDYLISTSNTPQTPEIIFSILLIDEKDNFEYFCHKYKVSNKLKKDLSYIANNYMEFKDEKNYLKKDLKKNIYKFGKTNIKKLITFIYCAEKFFSVNMLNKLISDVKKIEIPNFPFNGKYVMNQGLEDGKKIGFALKELEKEWIKSNFNLNNEEAVFIVDKVKKLNILNI